MSTTPAIHPMLASLLDADTQSSFQDSDGLISFVNLSSSFVTSNPEFEVGQSVCDKISNFFATLRIKAFTQMANGTIKPLQGDTVPTTQWDASVTHYLQYLLSQAGGLTNFAITNETYSVTQVIQDFSTAFVKLLFDAAVVPEAVITDVTNFLQGVGTSLRASWDDQSRTYQNALLGQCHEAVPEDASGQHFRYFPKVKYYYIQIDSSQTEFTTPCSATKTVTFNFKYEYYVTGLAADVLDKTTDLYKQFVTGFLDYAQGVNYKDAKNNLNTLLGGTTSAPVPAGPNSADALGGGSANIFGVNFAAYPALVTQPPRTIQTLLNTR